MRPFPPRSYRPTRLIPALGIVIAGVLGLLTAASPGTAGEYVVRYCQPGLPLQDWQRLANAPGALTDECAPGAVRFGATMGPNGGAAATGLTWLLRWPVGIRPVHLRAQANRLLHAGSGEVSGGIRPYGWCTTTSDGPCPSGAWTSVTVDHAINDADNAPGREFSIGIVCTGLTINPCGGGSGTLEVQQLDIVWQDTTPPTGTATLNGTTSPPNAIPLSGPQTIEYRSADGGGSGILRVEARVDGKPIVASPNQCAEPYVSMHACPTAAIGQLTLDTAQLDDGTHQLHVVAIDVAGNEHPLRADRIVTQNRDTIGPGSDPELRGTPNGTHPHDDAHLNAWWPATAKAKSKRKAVRKRCARSTRYRRTHTVACRGKAPSRKLAARFSPRASNTIRGRLLTTAGEPVAGATLRLVATPTASGATASALGTATTDATGRFSARLPARTGSTTIAVQWLARTRDTVPAATVELHRTVRAATTLKIKPSPTVYRRQNLELTGQLAGTTGNPLGTAIVIQANARTGWRAVTTIRAKANGHWTARYRVRSQLRGVYRFRAVVKPSAAYPYATGATKARRVRVR